MPRFCLKTVNFTASPSHPRPRVFFSRSPLPGPSPEPVSNTSGASLHGPPKMATSQHTTESERSGGPLREVEDLADILRAFDLICAQFWAKIEQRQSPATHSGGLQYPQPVYTLQSQPAERPQLPDQDSLGQEAGSVTTGQRHLPALILTNWEDRTGKLLKHCVQRTYLGLSYGQLLQSQNWIWEGGPQLNVSYIVAS
ncbi:Hypothetical predicted protein [Pelobates cultripes]|uniref:Uncharacterized protein n=1 Tax=Pelobates cultripes TaxID=61616 RepID=A0AAD1RQV4_PELCU|nr:Hypothetical predicted protein [Pelobates cultripes]